jgi:uncharacterized protein YqeY
MTLSERINQDLKLAMKSGDQVKLTTIRSIRAALIDFSKRGSDAPLTPDDETTLLLAASKKRKEAIEMYEKGGRMDLANQERQELGIIAEYLPKQMSREEAETIVIRLVAETGAAGAKDFSKVMPLAMKELKGKIDGKIVQEIVRQKIGD